MILGSWYLPYEHESKLLYYVYNLTLGLYAILGLYQIQKLKLFGGIIPFGYILNFIGI